MRRRARDRIPKLEPERTLRGPQDAALLNIQAGTDHVGRERQLERRREDDFGKQLPQFIIAVRLYGGQFGRDRREALHQEHLVPELRAVRAAAPSIDVVQDATRVGFFIDLRREGPIQGVAADERAPQRSPQ